MENWDRDNQSKVLNGWWWKSITIEKRWTWVSLHRSIKELSDFCSLSRGRPALSTWTSANLRNNGISGPNWGALMKVCSTSPILAIVVLHTCCTLHCMLPNTAESPGCTAGQSLILPNQHTSLLLLHCSACLLFGAFQSYHAKGLFIPSLREFHSAIAFIVSIAANSLVQSLLTALHWTFHVVLVPAYQMTEDFNIRSDKTQCCCFSPVMLWKIVIVSSKILHERVFTA